MRRQYIHPILLLCSLVSLLFSCHKVDEELDSISRQPGVYDLSSSNAFIGDTIEIRGRFNNASDLRFLFGTRVARIIGVEDRLVDKQGLVYGQGSTQIVVQAYKVIVPDSIRGSLQVTANFGGLTYPVGTFGVRQPPPLIPGKVLVSTFAGSDPDGNLEIHDDSLLKAKFGLIETMVVLPDGTIYTADFDYNNNQYYIREVSNGMVKTIAGGGTELEGPGANVYFGEIKGMAVDANGDIYIAERTYDLVLYYPFSLIVKLDKNTHEVMVFAGRAYNDTDLSTIVDGPRQSAIFSDIGDISFDVNGNLYVADYGNNTIRKIAADGTVSSPVAAMSCNGGCYVLDGNQDGFGSEVRLSGPTQIAAALNGRVYFTEFSVLKELNPPSTEVTSIAGVPDNHIGKYGPLATATFHELRSVAPDAEGNILVVDESSVLKVDLKERYVYILAGSGPRGYKDGTGENAMFNQPTEVGFDAKGNFYVADRVNRLIRKITVQ